MCNTDGKDSYCFVKGAQRNARYFGAVIACRVVDSECEAFMKIKIDTDDTNNCNAEFVIDVDNKQKYSKTCKVTFPSYIEYMGCCASANCGVASSPTTRRRSMVCTTSPPTRRPWRTSMTAASYTTTESRCEPQVSISFTIAMEGLDIPGATEKEIEALVALISEDFAAYANVEEADVMATVTDLGDGVTEIEIVIMADNESASSAVTANVTNINETNFVEIADSKLVSKDGLKVDEVMGGSFLGVAALVPTAFTVLCALVALLFKAQCLFHECAYTRSFCHRLCQHNTHAHDYS
jgi:hypothetical protein